MDQRDIRRLEDELEQAIKHALEEVGEQRLPIKPTREITHAMAKAAVTVYEAVANDRNA